MSETSWQLFRLWGRDSINEDDPMTAYTLDAPRQNPVSIMLRNIAAHFDIRASSWFMATMTFAVGIVLTINPTLLTKSPNATVYFAHMAGIADQWVWRALFLVAGTTRLMSLAINGSFPTVHWTPHVRLVMSVLSVFLWLQVAISVVDGAPTIGTIVYPFIVIFEIHNVRRALQDVKGSGDH